MKDYLISMYIDNELNLDEKIEFVETVHQQLPFKNETVEFIRMEKELRDDLVYRLPEISEAVEPDTARPWFLSPFLSPLAAFATVLIVAVILFTLKAEKITTTTAERLHRFVIYKPETKRAEIIGTFTGWTPVPMKQIGATGYWELELKLADGEHRYNFIFGNGTKIADPTVISREPDDFGGENSIINITTRTI